MKGMQNHNNKCPFCGKRTARFFVETREIRVRPGKYPDCLGFVDFDMAECKSCGANAPRSMLKFMSGS